MVKKINLDKYIGEYNIIVIECPLAIKYYELKTVTLDFIQGQFEYWEDNENYERLYYPTEFPAAMSVVGKGWMGLYGQDLYMWW
jgi:hypothetical protein